MVVSVVCACSRVYGIISLFSAWFCPETNGWGPPPFCRLSLWCYFLAFYSCLRRYPHMFCYNIGMAWSSGPYNSHASKVFAGREFEKYTGQQQEVGIFKASVSIHNYWDRNSLLCAWEIWNIFSARQQIYLYRSWQNVLSLSVLWGSTVWNLLLAM